MGIFIPRSLLPRNGTPNLPFGYRTTRTLLKFWKSTPIPFQAFQKPKGFTQRIKQFFEARKQLKAEGYSAVVGTGGGFTAPILLAAWTLGIPIILLEQNVLPGRVTRWLSPLSKVVCISFAESTQYLTGSNVRLTGNPIRKTFLKDPLRDVLLNWVPNSHPILLVFGGSQGAKSINDFFKENHEKLRSRFNIIHIVGWRDFADFTNSPYLAENGSHDVGGWLVLPYFEEMDLLYSKVDYVVCRAGATSIAELVYFNKPGIAIPYPHSKDDHQIQNAQALSRMKRGISLKKEIVFSGYFVLIERPS